VERWGKIGVADDLQIVPSKPGSYPAFYAGVVAAIRDGAAPPVNARDAVTGLEIIEAAHRSATERRIVAT
jgi:scyllo-inositol 2-dehydrogenase (NADP+)